MENLNADISVLSISLSRFTRSAVLLCSSNETIPSQRTVCSGASGDSRRCKSRRNTETTLLYQSPDSRKSSTSGSASCRAILKSFDFPGIHISHIATVDVEDEETTEELEQVEEPCSDPAIPKYVLGFRRNIPLSDAYSDTSRVSFPSSDCGSAFAGSRSRGSRPSSRESCVLSPRLWDFSPRESDSDLGTPIDIVFREDFVHRSGGGARDKGSWTRAPTGGLEGEVCRGFRETGGGQFVHHSRMPRKGSLVTVNYARTSSRASSVKSSVRSSP